MSLAGILVLGYDGAVMRRDVHLAMVAFWTSVPLFAVYLAVSWPHLGWPGEALLYVVVASSGFLTARLSLPAPSREEGGKLPEPSSARSPRLASESLVYPLTLVLAVYLLSSQLLFF
jgi:hypothetical protein